MLNIAMCVKKYILGVHVNACFDSTIATGAKAFSQLRFKQELFLAWSKTSKLIKARIKLTLSSNIVGYGCVI